MRQDVLIFTGKQRWFWKLVSVINIYNSIKVNSPDLTAEWHGFGLLLAFLMFFQCPGNIFFMSFFLPDTYQAAPSRNFLDMRTCRYSENSLTLPSAQPWNKPLTWNADENLATEMLRWDVPYQWIELIITSLKYLENLVSLKYSVKAFSTFNPLS